jgi:hypothetical protein
MIVQLSRSFRLCDTNSLPLASSFSSLLAPKAVPRRAYSMKFDGNANHVLGAIGKPPFIYGTAWKKENTNRLVKEALNAGFRAIDTAAQPKHYREDLVGDALREAYQDKIVTRGQLFVSIRADILDITEHSQS